MTFKKGQSGNPAGKPKGAKCEKTKQWEQLGKYIIEEGAQRYMNALVVLEDKDYVERFERVLEYFRPKLARTESKLEHEGGINIKIVKYGEEVDKGV